MNKTHGMYGTLTYNSWVSMKRRCNDKNATGYAQYGGIGINYCATWETFEGFFADMGVRPKGTTLNRKDNNKGYSADNCNWATYKQQTVNRRQTLFFTFRGETLCQRDWEIKLGLSRGSLYHRIVTCKWSIDDALTLPKKSKRNCQCETSLL